MADRKDVAKRAGHALADASARFDRSRVLFEMIERANAEGETDHVLLLSQIGIEISYSAYGTTGDTADRFLAEADHD
ncbi:hypothetical protein B0G75_117115 [Paraburkholderia sp. BL18I3N2]|uniref:hypothetical protein n=1 Tax=Paraburkholderia sp. BL18I3N2 TaxID=1938799 RepID=UPI000D065BA6|nr:hypothetical protein [Paraburkholderia sp. BL18I3N2]PRX26831.1 hypothetical protein B0G75_117115 [Paraburkholderia sp. BL18I3N2]